MEFLATEAEGVRTVRLVGNFEPSEAPRFVAAVERAIEEGCVYVVVDMEDAHLVCSAGVGAFLRAHRALKKGGGELVCAALPRFAGEIFRTVGLDRQVRCFETVDDAVAALSA